MKSSLREIISDINNSKYGEVYYYIYGAEGTKPKPVTYTNLKIDERLYGGAHYAINDLRHYLTDSNDIEKLEHAANKTMDNYRKIYSIKRDDIKFVEMHLF